MRLTARLALMALCASTVTGLGTTSAHAADRVTKGPGQVCKTALVPGEGGVLVPIVGGYFAKQGGCAGTVAHGALEDPQGPSALTTRAGYVQQCQLIRTVEGFPFDFDYPWITFDQEVDSIGECADVLKAIHSTPFPVS